MEVKVGYKNTDFGIIPDDWQVLLIDDLIKQGIIEKPIDGNHGNIHPKSSDFVSDGIPFVMANNIVDGQLVLNKSSFIRQEQADNLQKGFSHSDDVLLTHKGTVGSVTIVGRLTTPYIMLTPQVTYYRVKDKDRIFNKYIKSYFEGDIFQTILKQLSGGGTRAYIGITNQRQLPFIFPPLPEQKAIAEVLSDNDNLIQSLEKLIAKKRLIKQRAKQKLLTPKYGWKVKSLDKIVQFINGKAHEQYIDERGEYIVINSKFVSTGGRIRKYSKKILCPLKKGDITMVMSDIPNGKALAKCFIVPENEKYSLNQRICALRTDSVNKNFLASFLNRNDYYLAYDNGTGQTNLKKGDVLKCLVPLPPTMGEQNHIATILSEMDAEIELLEKQLSKYKFLKQGLMQNLLTGKIRLIKT